MPRPVSNPPQPELRAPSPTSATRGGVVYDAVELGQVVRWTRGRSQMTLEDLAPRLGVSKRLLVELEHGARGVRLGTVLDVLARLGYDVVLVPRDSGVSLQPAPQESP